MRISYRTQAVLLTGGMLAIGAANEAGFLLLSMLQKHEQVVGSFPWKDGQQTVIPVATASPLAVFRSVRLTVTLDTTQGGAVKCRYAASVPDTLHNMDALARGARPKYTAVYCGGELDRLLKPRP
jgi:hypothetical protein